MTDFLVGDPGDVLSGCSAGLISSLPIMCRHSISLRPRPTRVRRSTPPRRKRLLLIANYVPLQSTRRKSINITMPKSDHKAALLAIEKVLALLRSVKMLEGTDKDGVEHLLEMAVEKLKN